MLQDSIANTTEYGIRIPEGCTVTTLPSFCVAAIDECVLEHYPLVKGTDEELDVGAVRMVDNNDRRQA